MPSPVTPSFPEPDAPVKPGARFRGFGADHLDSVVARVLAKIDTYCSATMSSVDSIRVPDLSSLKARFSLLNDKDRAFVRAVFEDGSLADEEKRRGIVAYGQSQVRFDAAKMVALGVAGRIEAGRCVQDLSGKVESLVGTMGRGAPFLGSAAMTDSDGNAVRSPLNAADERSRKGMALALAVLVAGSALLMTNYLQSSGSPLFMTALGAWIVAPMMALLPVAVGVALSAWLSSRPAQKTERIRYAMGIVLGAAFLLWVVAMACGFAAPAAGLSEVLAGDGALADAGSHKGDWSPLLLASEAAIETSGTLILDQQIRRLLSQSSPTLPTADPAMLAMAMAETGLVRCRAAAAAKEAECGSVPEECGQIEAHYVSLLLGFFGTLRPPEPAAYGF